MGSFNYEDKLFYICVTVIVITFLIGLTKAKPYAKDNEVEQARTQKVLCLIYGVFFILGAYGAMIAFLLYYIRFLGKHSWTKSVSISLSVPVVCFFFFDIAMRIVLPKGYLEPLFIPLYDIFL